MSSQTVRSGIDSWTDSSIPSQNAGGGIRLQIQGGGSPTKNAFVWLSNPVPRGATVTSGKLRLRGVGDWGGSVTVDVQLIAAKWVESSIDDDNQPGVTGSTVSLTLHETTDATLWEFDVAPLLQSVANGTHYYGFRVSTADTSEHRFYSLQAGDNQPTMHAAWELPPDAPTELVPSSGSAVSGAKPVLTGNYHDVTGSSSMAALQVQINPTNSFGSPAFDSGTVTSADPELALSGTAYAGLANGDTAWWRMRVQNGAGQWSPWSDSTSFTRVNKASVAIDNPADVPDNFVNDPTPPFSWTVTGGAQLQRRIVITSDDDPTVHLLNTGRQTTSATTYTPPKGVLKDGTGGTVYRLTLRVWENNTRTATPGDTTYIETVRTFTFVEDPTPNPVTGFTAAQVANGKPHVLLEWSRATAPDQWTIERNGVIIDHAVSAADLFVSGTSYSYVDVTAEPHTSHSYKVRPRVNGKLGPSPTATVSYEADAIWLTDPDTPSRLVPIRIGEGGQASFDMPEIDTVLRPVNGTRAVRFVQGKFGLEGHIDGYIGDFNGGSADTWVANLLWMKEREETNVVRLTMGDQNLHVKIKVAVVPLERNVTGWRAVAVDFWSLDGVTQR